MRIVFVTDIHGSLQSLKILLETTRADLYLIGGDLLKGAFRSTKNLFRFSELQQRFNLLKCRLRTEVMTRTFVESRLDAADADEKEKARAREYLRLHRLAGRTMLRDLNKLEDLLSSFPHKRILVLPGNYDMDLEETDLRERNLHRKTLSVDGVRIAGYGSAKVTTPGIPEDLAIPFQEYKTGGGLFSEPRDFFSEARPDLVVLHMPPFGFLDRLRAYGHLGSVGVRDYIDQFPPNMVLCGHMHESWGVERLGRTVLVNPSNFGMIPNVMGEKRGGYFFDFILEDTFYRIGTLRQLERGKIYDLADFPLEETQKGQALKKRVVDPDRMRCLGREKTTAQQGLRRIRDFRRVRDFFRQYETEATKKRIQDLRRVYRKLRKMGEDVAFDVLGSVNFGMSEPGSDVDLVIYRRCPCDHPLPETSCTLPRALWECFQGLEEQYSIDVTDCVNLNKVEASIRAGDAECPALQRFVLYRLICRPINLRMIRETENKLLELPALKKKVEYLLKDYFNMMVLSQSHILSFKKYEVRLHDQGVNLPVGVEGKLRAYLGLNGQVH